MSGFDSPLYAPVWKGEPLEGRRILLVAEQGLDDTLHLIRYAPLVARMGAQVSAIVPSPLRRLIASTPGVVAVYELGAVPPPHDLCVPLVNLPGVFGPREATIPADLPHLRVPDEARRFWRNRLAGETRLKVGLVWAGVARPGDSDANCVDRRRSITLDALAPLSGVEGVAFYSLQKGEAAAQALIPPDGMALVDLSGDLDDFADTAALVAELDLVITVDTAVCHLAGGLGRPVWVLSRLDTCWRWLGNRETSPWHPTIRLFYQDRRGDWMVPIARLAAALARLVEGRAIQPRLGNALALHRAGDIARASIQYRRILTIDPAQADALHLLGVAALGSNTLTQADLWLHRAVAIATTGSFFFNSLGELWRRRRQSEDARRCYRHAVVAKPDYAEPLINLAKLQAEGGHMDAARRLLERVTALAPMRCDGWVVLGNVAVDSGRLDRAVSAGKRAASLAPADAAVWGLLARAAAQRGGMPDDAPLNRALRTEPENPLIWRLRADALVRQDCPDAAEACLHRAIALAPERSEATANLCAHLLGHRRVGEAMPLSAHAVVLGPDQAEPWSNRGNALQECGLTEDARRHYRRALALDPARPAAYANLAESFRSRALTAEDFAVAGALCRRALVLTPDDPAILDVSGVIDLDIGHLDAAEATFRRILAVRPDHPEARVNLALVLLKTGRLREGWDYYESRWNIAEFPAPHVHGALWTGEPLEGRSILLFAEQGLGDAIQFCRYLPMVARLGATIHLALPPALHRLMARLPGNPVIHDLHAPPPRTDFNCPLLSLPRAFATDLATIPTSVPYLDADPADVARWRARLDGDHRFRVGLVWAGDPRPGNPRANGTDRRRSLPLSSLAPLATVAGVRFISLQKGKAANDARPADLDLFDPVGELHDFADTAALVTCLDLVIAVDTSVCHLTGALGRPVWVLSRHDGCWRWLTGRDDSPWYPTLRLFRQRTPGLWQPVIADVVAALAHHVAGLPANNTG